jgi:hypothetical protein
MKMTVFWDVALCSLVEIDQSFRGAYCLHHQNLMIEEVCTSETSVNFYETTWRNITEDSHLHPESMFFSYDYPHEGSKYWPNNWLYFCITK